METLSSSESEHESDEHESDEELVNLSRKKAADTARRNSFINLVRFINSFLIHPMFQLGYS